MRWLFLVNIFILLLFPTTVYADSNCNCSIKSLGTLYLIGDSQCAGASMIATRVAETKQWTKIKSTCKVSTQTSYWMSRASDFRFTKDDVVVVYLGSNDSGKPNPAPILAKIAQANAKCVWVGPPLIRGKDNGVANHLKKTIGDDATCEYLDSRAINLQLVDGVHPNIKEHTRWLRLALAKLPL